MATNNEGSMNTPASSGYFMPAEWEAHEGTWLQWPSNGVEPGYEMKQERIWLEMVVALIEHEKVSIIVGTLLQRDHVAYLLDYFGIGHDKVDLHIIPANDVWARDNGPIFLIDEQGELAISNWRFNGWGNRFEHDLDDQIPKIIGERLSVPVFDPPLVLEGGAVEVNGQGTFMGTRSSIIDPFRNPGKCQAEIEAILGQYLGVTHFIWLTGASRGECEKWGDTTDSHIDIVARFTNGSTVLYNWTDDKADPRYGMFAKHEEELKAATIESGQPLTLVRLPVPEDGVFQVANHSAWRESLFTDAAYSNYLVANGVVLVPIFGNVNDDQALGIIGEQFPDREIIGLNVVSLVEDGGAIHCVTQQQPAKKRGRINQTGGSEAFNNRRTEAGLPDKERR